MKSNYQLDRSLGLEYFITDTEGIGGRLRERVEDFVVEELPKSVPVSAGGDYTHFTLEKRNWETIAAVKAIARALGASSKRFGYAGTKDKRAITKQRVAAWRVEEERLREVRIKDILLYDFARSEARLSLGDSAGNRFKIAIREPRLRGKKLEEALSTTRGEIAAKGVPNYFGYQRFGITRPNTHLVGRELVKGDLEGAVMQYLGSPYDTESNENQRARSYLEDMRDYRGALELYPKGLKYERAMLDALAKNPHDYAGALRRLPKKLGGLLVHAYQAYLFNRMLNAMIDAGMELRNSNLPLFGYRSKLSEGAQGEIVKKILDEEGVTARNFFLRSIPELSSEGSIRSTYIEVKPVFEIATDETLEGKEMVIVNFDLPSGSYATVVLREFMKADPSNY